jgi:hypothetical protein
MICEHEALQRIIKAVNEERERAAPVINCAQNVLTWMEDQFEDVLREPGRDSAEKRIVTQLKTVLANYRGES